VQGNGATDDVYVSSETTVDGVQVPVQGDTAASDGKFKLLFLSLYVQFISALCLQVLMTRKGSSILMT
jgi:hypothetical protein